VAGRYTVSITALRGPEQGQVQLFQDEVPVGEPVDLYSEALAKSDRLKLGMQTFQAGDNPVMLKLVGKNAQAGATGLDLIEVICTRVP
jgi:hypothetical protein